MVRAAGDGHGGALAFTGGWGFGRSALLAASGAAAESFGSQVLRARCARDDGALEHGVALQLFENARRGSRARSMFAGAELAARFVKAPEGVDPSPRGAALLLHALCRAVANLARERPLAILVDDVQWADRASLRFLLQLATRLPDQRVTLLMTAREPSPGGGERAHSELLAEIPTRRLAPLSRQATHAVLSRQTGGCSAQLGAMVHRGTGGVPALVAEAARALAAEGRSEPTPDGLADVLVTAWLRRRIDAELARLPQGARAVAQTAAELGAASTSHRIAVLSGVDAERLPAIEAALEEAGIFAPGRPSRFAQPVLAAAVRALTPAAEAARIHAGAARLLRDEGEADDLVGAHLLRTPPAARAWVAADLMRAAEAAMERDEIDLALALLTRARAEPPPPAERAAVCVALGRAQAAAGQPAAAAATLASVARSAARPTGAIEASLALARLRADQGEIRAAATLLEEATAMTGAADPGRAELEAGWLAVALGDATLRPAAAGLANEAPAGHRRSSAAWLANAACHLALSNTSGERARSLARRALDSQPSREARAAAAQALLWTGDVEDARRALGGGEAPSGVAPAGEFVLPLAQCAHHDGRLTEAANLARRAAEKEAFHAETPAARLARIEVDLGDARAAERLLNEALAGAPADGSLARAGQLLARAVARNALGRYREALADATTAGRTFDAAGVDNPAVASWRSAAGLAAARLGDSERGRALTEEELERARAQGAPSALAAALRAAAEVAGGTEAIELLREAETMLRGSRARCERAAVLVELGAAYRKHGSQSRARAVLREALAGADQIGATALEDRARAELELAAARPRRRLATGPEALTAAEWRVVELAIEGLSNREIASRLFVAQKTVEWHLRNCFRKLDVRSRRELAPALEREAA